VEHAFSNSGDLMSDHHAHTLGTHVIEACMIIKDNWIYPEFRPTMSKIKEAYVKVHGASRTYEEDEEDGEDGDDGDEKCDTQE
jgi:hypothetical protein